jgi:hypothetical protein
MPSPSALFVEGERTGKFRLGAVEAWPIVASKGRRFVQSCIEIDIPVIAAVNGPIPVHSEVALLADVVIAEDRAWFQDPHMLGVSLRDVSKDRGDAASHTATPDTTLLADYRRGHGTWLATRGNECFAEGAPVRATRNVQIRNAEESSV